MPPAKKQALRGAAKLNRNVENVANTNTVEYRDRYAGRYSTDELLPPAAQGEMLQGSPPPTLHVVAAAAHRSAKRGGGCSRAGGKCAKTLYRRLLALEEVLAQEKQHQEACMRVYEQVEGVLRDREHYLAPEAERLGYSTMHLSDKYFAIRTYFWHRAHGACALWASEQAGWHWLVSGRTVRRWAADYMSEHDESDSAPRKVPYSFSPYRMGGHVEWLLSNEVLERKARKWIALHAEQKGKGNMNIESFHDFLCGTYDSNTKSWSERGLLSAVLEAAGKTSISLETARTYLHRCAPTFTCAEMC